jgi:hypothetical protein
VLAEAQQHLAVVAATGAAGDAPLLQEHRPGAGPGQVQGRGDAGDAAANEDDVSPLRQRLILVGKRWSFLDPEAGHSR